MIDFSTMANIVFSPFFLTLHPFILAETIDLKKYALWALLHSNQYIPHLTAWMVTVAFSFSIRKHYMQQGRQRHLPLNGIHSSISICQHNYALLTLSLTMTVNLPTIQMLCDSIVTLSRSGSTHSNLVPLRLKGTLLALREEVKFGSLQLRDGVNISFGPQCCMASGSTKQCDVSSLDRISQRTMEEDKEFPLQVYTTSSPGQTSHQAPTNVTESAPARIAF